MMTISEMHALVKSLLLPGIDVRVLFESSGLLFDIRIGRIGQRFQITPDEPGCEELRRRVEFIINNLKQEGAS